MTPGCGHGQKTVDLVRDVLQALAPNARLETITVVTTAEAQRIAFPGSPTVRINGTDIDSQSTPGDVGLG